MKNELITRINILLNGIDQTETDSINGWWETSAGAEFGAMKLAALLELIESDHEAAKQEIIDLNKRLTITTRLLESTTWRYETGRAVRVNRKRS